MQTKFIFITGGVVSGLGKGIAAASIGALLESRGLTVSLMKLDPYINVDAGTMNPFQHGEVFVTVDGAETDLDLGHYERYTNAVLTRRHNRTTGQIYDAVIRKERAGDYLGATVQVIPHVIDEIKDTISEAARLAKNNDKSGTAPNADICIVEIGGTVGDIESLPFLEAIRQYRHDHGRENTLFIHLTLIIQTTEMKTKPTQHSVGKLREIGIQPDILICRTSEMLTEKVRSKISLFTNVPENSVVNGLDVESVYEAPLMFHQQELDNTIMSYLQMWTGSPKLQPWVDLIDNYKNPQDEVDIAFIGKYVAHRDSYESLNEALLHGGIANRLKVNLHYIDSEFLTEENVVEQLKDMDGVLVAPGFGERGTEGKISAIQIARTKKIPFFGICLGMQMAFIEFARNVVGIKTANSGESRPDHPENVIDLMPEQEGQEETGGTMRLGSQTTELKKGTLIADIYNKTTISERHRHRYEVMNYFVPRFEEAGMTISGRHPERNLVETIELQEHPWFIGCQYHPELQSKPLRPHPLFSAFIAASYVNRQTRLGLKQNSKKTVTTSNV
ncbi:MAG: CTP synthase [SAR324 cluster bacterium]|nr:CTP synthase [SAR324 cluster bacterium]MBL7034972.1 CTP synthase [SAR324 cluster bacterium]